MILIDGEVKFAESMDEVRARAIADVIAGWFGSPLSITSEEDFRKQFKGRSLGVFFVAGGGGYSIIIFTVVYDSYMRTGVLEHYLELQPIQSATIDFYYLDFIDPSETISIGDGNTADPEENMSRITDDVDHSE